MTEIFRIIGQYEYNWLQSLRKRAVARLESGWKAFQLIMPKKRIKGFPYGERLVEYEDGKWSYAVNCDAFLGWSEKRMNAQGVMMPNSDLGRSRLPNTKEKGRDQ